MIEWRAFSRGFLLFFAANFEEVRDGDGKYCGEKLISLGSPRE
jgi:hypothetical protein